VGSASRRRRSDQEPEVRIHLPPAESPREPDRRRGARPYARRDGLSPIGLPWVSDDVDCARPWAVRSTAATFSPLPNNPNTSSRPIPPAAPVTIATRCCLLIFSSLRFGPRRCGNGAMQRKAICTLRRVGTCCGARIRRPETISDRARRADCVFPPCGRSTTNGDQGWNG